MTSMRVLAAAAVLVSALVHLHLWWWEDYRNVDVIGPAFLLNGVGGVLISLLLLTWRSRVPPVLAVGFGVSTLGAFVVSTTVGLFGVHESWQGWAVWAAAAAELVAIVAGALLLLGGSPLGRGGRHQRHRSTTG